MSMAILSPSVKKQKLYNVNRLYYTAITMRRSYKPPRTHEEAIGIIREVAGTQLDKKLVDIFLTIPKEELVRCMPEEVKY